MADLFGYSRSGNAIGEVASNEFCTVNIGGKLALAQNVSTSYTQKIDEVRALGDSNIYWVPGRPSGQISISKLVGTGGFFSGWNPGACGVINGLSVSLGGGACFKGSGSLSFTGAVAETFSLEMNSQNQTISESCQIKVATISK